MTTATLVAIAASGLQLVGVGLIAWGLYNRWPDWQRKARIGRGRVRRFLRWLFRRPKLPVELQAEAASLSTIGGELTAKGQLPRDPDPSVEERLDWLENVMGRTRDELNKEEENRATADRELGQRFDDLDRRNAGEHAELRQDVAQASVPHWAEVWGAGLVFVGLVGQVVPLLLG